MFFNVLNAGPTQPAPVQQSDYRVPTTNSAVASYAIGGNVLNLSWPLPAFVEKLSVADDPQGSIRGGRSGH